jgi:gliding motility-associated-like protein
MKKLLAILLCSVLFLAAKAEHIRGGEMSYRYLGPGVAPGTSSYRLKLLLYVNCQSTGQQLDASANFTIFRNASNTQFGAVLVANLTDDRTISYDPNSNPCITNPPTDVCYRLRTYELTTELPDDPSGYTISFQRCCRINGIENINPPTSSNSYGATYTTSIPGTGILPLPQHNSSPTITGNDAVAICTNSSFTFDFSATDIDGDSLVYELCDAFTGASRGQPVPPASTAPPYNSIPYNNPYSGSFPLGLQASINPSTGVITGIAPPTVAQYVVTVCISEFRNGQLINVHRKDIHLKVADCNPLKALLKPDYSYCDDFAVTFRNEQDNPSGTVYIWNYGDGSAPDTTSNPFGSINHTYADTGTYTIKLKAILAGQCFDSTTTLARVYPGFFPGFTSLGTCILNAIQFTDTTRTRYGFVSAWRWNFDDASTLADTSHLRNPSWKYSTIGTKRVELIVQSDRGCIDTVYQQIEVKDKPIITLAFKDTLICSNLPIQDTLMLSASGLGTYNWTPNTRIVNANTATPLVFPTTTTKYVVELNESGCVNTDTVTVRVVPQVTLDAGPDSTICLTDAAVLNPTGDGLRFTWTPAATLNNPNIKRPTATPTATTTYTVLARIGKCNATDNVTITTIPYPGAFAGPDETICYLDSAILNGNIVGSSFSWSPANTLSNANSLTPVAYPIRTTTYILTVFDVLGCPKPGRDTVVITVRPQIFANAGNDTSVVIGQPLQLNASGAPLFAWSPPINLSRTDIANPIAVFQSSGVYTYALVAYTPENCLDTDTINIKVFNTAPDIFVPNAFTPKKQVNNIFRPIPVGITKIDYFRIYNRWGQLLFSSAYNTDGWNGTFNGKDQDPGTYVWMVQGVDYTGKVITKKGSFVLIR